MTLANLKDVPFEKEQIAIAVSHSALGSGHIGIGFHSAKSGPQVLHLAWHRDLRVQRIPEELQACWATEALSVPPKASKQIVAYVRVIAARMPAISYGCNFLSAKGSFSPNGSYKPPKNSSGLTCASFVLEVLRGSRVDLVDGATWRHEAANESWAQGVCSILQEKGADSDHVAAVRRDINGLRLRPFELAAAARLGAKYWPAKFDDVQASAKEVEEQLASVCPAERGDTAPPTPTTH